MNAKKFSDAMSELDTKYVDEALSYRKRTKKPGWMKWGAIAACLCMVAAAAIAIPSFQEPQESDGEGGTPAPVSDVVAEPGFLMVTAYAASPDENMAGELPSDEEVMMQEGIEVPVKDNWSLAMSSRPGIPLKLSAPEYEGMIFEVSADGGELLLWEEGKIINLGSSYSVKNNTTVYWTSMARTEDDDFELYTESEAYIHIVIREQENIVGYAVVEIYRDGLEDDPAQTYYAKLLRSVSFPKVDGEYQNVAAEYVESEMERVKSQ